MRKTRPHVRTAGKFAPQNKTDLAYTPALKTLSVNPTSMFTGLIEEVGRTHDLSHREAGARLSIRAPKICMDARLGDSIAVNGCCLTIASRDGEILFFELLAETLIRTNLGSLTTGAAVNLERALPATGRLGGHFVQGHIDCTTRIVTSAQQRGDYRLEIELPSEFAPYVAYKGAIAVDGISLTVAELHPASFVVWIIPHTYSMTNVQERQHGDVVNLECDLLAKYVERMLGAANESCDYRRVRS